MIITEERDYDESEQDRQRRNLRSVGTCSKNLLFLFMAEELLLNISLHLLCQFMNTLLFAMLQTFTHPITCRWSSFHFKQALALPQTTVVCQDSLRTTNWVSDRFMFSSVGVSGTSEQEAWAETPWVWKKGFILKTDTRSLWNQQKCPGTLKPPLASLRPPQEAEAVHLSTTKHSFSS